MAYADFARVYDRLMADTDYPRRAAFFHTLAGRFRAPGKLLLDLCCGTGSISHLLLERGYEVIGVDRSPEMLSVAAEKYGGRVLLLCQDCRALDLYGTVDITVSALDSLNHLPDRASLCQAFERVSLFTAPGGLFLFDMNTPYKHQQVLGRHTFVTETEDLYCVWQNWLEGPDHRVEIRLDFFERRPGGAYARSGEQFAEIAFSPEEVERMLRSQGMTLLALYDAETEGEPQPDSERLLYVARK